jgi:hypothetical protein
MFTPLTRRHCLKLGLLGLGGIPLGTLLQARAPGAAPTSVRAKSCILLWLDGGPSHLETFDPKPAAPLEVRGPFSTISTSVPGIHLSELLPRTAQVLQHVAVLRSLTSPLGEHGIANQYLLTGYKPSPVLTHPSYGAVLAHQRASQADDGTNHFPSYIAIPETRLAWGAGFLGNRYEPFATGGDPAQPDFRVRDLEVHPSLNRERLQRRAAYLRELNRPQQAASATNEQQQDSFAAAFRLTQSPEVRQAFDLSAEPAKLRGQYGPRTFGQSCLLARRLVERGVPFVSVLQAGWDTHEGLVLQLRDGYSGAKVGVGLVPTFDAAFATLVEDLDQRGMLDDTLLVAMGEFGRTPKLNTRGGRDHWPRVFSAVMAGGGIRGGQVIGASDRVGESPLDRPITPADLACTLFTLLGIDPTHALSTADGRPIPINQGGTFIRELTA